MKKNIRIKTLLLIVFVMAGSVMAASYPALATERWQDMPPLVLSDCVDIDKVLAPNPLSSEGHDFWMVLKYEEIDEESGRRKAGLGEQSLNMYLVTGLALLVDEGVGLPYYQFLIVTQTNGGTSEKIVQQWLLSDTDNDGKVDKAKFERTISGSEGETIRSDKVEVPDDQVRSLQGFFERATSEINSKAENGTSEQCLVS
jgi:hypothetical protein